MSRVYLNGVIVDRAAAQLPLDDRGFYFGDGVYEVVRVVQGRVFLGGAHRQRLERSLTAISLAVPEALSGEGMELLCRRLIEENDLAGGEATVYLQVTRGAAPRTHAFPAEGTPPTVFASASPFVIPARLREEGAPAVTTPDIRWARCDIKSLNLLPNVMAKQRAAAAGAFEALFIRDGILTEGSSSNVFAVVNGVLRTYPLSNYILPGITRTVVLDLAAEAGVAVVQEPITWDELRQVDELFATATTMDVQPLVSVDGQPIGDGYPGPVTRRLQTALTQRMAR